jgi:hypothetical protein
VEGELGGRADTVQKIITALEKAGCIFLDENGEGPGVRLRKAKRKARNEPWSWRAIQIGRSQTHAAGTWGRRRFRCGGAGRRRRVSEAKTIAIIILAKNDARPRQVNHSVHRTRFQKNRCPVRSCGCAADRFRAEKIDMAAYVLTDWPMRPLCARLQRTNRRGRSL